MNQDKNTNQEEKPKIAWYESNANMIAPLTYYLEKYFRVEVFRNPYEAEDGIAGCRPDIVIFDYRMDIYSGVQMFEMLKKRKLSFIPIFLTIWGSDESTITEIKNLGVERKAIFDKDIDPADFARKVNHYYLQKKGEHE